MLRGMGFLLVVAATVVTARDVGATESRPVRAVVAAHSGITAVLAPVVSSGTPTAADPARPEEEALPVDYWSMLFVLVLSTFVGLGVIGRVSRLLHTPLMSLTNAISAIAVVGSIVVTGGSDYPVPIRILGAVALFASMANIVSGFLITDRMLKMFKQVRPPQPAASPEQPAH